MAEPSKNPIEKLLSLPEDKQKELFEKLPIEVRQGLYDQMSIGFTQGQRYTFARHAGLLPTYNAPQNAQEGLTQFASEAAQSAQEYQTKASPEKFKGGKPAGHRPFLEQMGRGAQSMLAEGAGEGAQLAAGLMDPKTLAAFVVSKLSPSGQVGAAMYFGLQNSQQLYDSIKDGKISPENVQKALNSLAGMAGAGAMAGEKSPASLRERASALNERARSVARNLTEVRPAVKATLEKGTKVAERLNLEKNIDRESLGVGKQIGELEKKVAQEADRKFEAVKEKIGAGKPGEPTASPEPIVDAVNSAKATILMNVPENVAQLKAVMNLGGESGAMGELRQQVMQGQGMKGNYVDLAPEEKAVVDEIAQRYGGDITEGEPVTWGKLQRLKTNLEKALQSSSMEPTMRMALRYVDNRIIETMGKMAEEKGATAEWEEAKKFWGEWREDFHEAKGPSSSGSPVAASRAAVDPKYIRDPLSGPKKARAQEILKKYGKFGGNEAAASTERIIQTQSRASQLPRKAAGVEVSGEGKVSVDIDENARQKIAETAQRIGKLNAWDARIMASSVMVGVLAPFLGVERGVEMGAGFVLTKYMLARALENPKIIDWIAKTPPAELEALQRIKGDQVKIKSALTDAVVKAENGFPDQSGEMASFDRAKAELGPNADPQKVIQRAQELKRSTRYGKAVNISPGLKAYLGPENVARIMAAAGTGKPPESRGPVKQPVQNRREAMDALKRQPVQ